MEEIFATFIMLVIYSLFFLLFLISVERLSLLVCVELAYRNLQRYKKIKKSLLFDSTFTNKSLSNIIELQKGRWKKCFEKKKHASGFTFGLLFLSFIFFLDCIVFVQILEIPGYDFTITFYLCFPATLCLFSPWFVYLGVHESCYG